MFLKDFIVSIVVFFCGSYLVSQDFRSPIDLWIVKNPANAWSSLCYALPITTLEVKVPLLTLSVASFALWSNETIMINFIDDTLTTDNNMIDGLIITNEEDDNTEINFDDI